MMTCVVSTLKSRRFTASIAIITLLTVLLSLLPCSVKAEGVEAETLFNDVVAFNVGNDSLSASEWINGSLSALPEGNEWYAIGLAKAFPEADLSPYASALETYLIENSVGSASTKQKYALALIACGRGD